MDWPYHVTAQKRIETFGRTASGHPPVSTVHYSERQHFRQDWLWALLLVGSVPAALLASVAIAVDSAPGTTVPLWIAVVLLLVFGPLVGFYYANLRIEVRDNGLSFRLWPIHLRARTITCEEIESIRATEISPMGEFGGVGIRLTPTLYRWGIRFDGPAGYIVEGKHAVRIERTDGREIVLTSTDPYTLARALERVCR
jgi:hypothetical protein